MVARKCLYTEYDPNFFVKMCDIFDRFSNLRLMVKPNAAVKYFPTFQYFSTFDMVVPLCLNPLFVLTVCSKVKVTYIGADLAELSQIETLYQKILEVYPEGLDILVNCAGEIVY